MLVATPYRDFDEPPRVIAGIRKTYADFAPLSNFRPKLTGDLLVKCGNDSKWWPRKVSIRNGQLQFAGGLGEGPPASMRLPLRYLSLRAGPLTNSLSLCRGQNVVLTIQTAKEQLFDLWVKTIAIELIRQTPLEAVKYLDIFTLANCWKRKDPNDYKDCNFNYLEPKETPQYETCNPATTPEAPEPRTPTTPTPISGIVEECVEEKTVETLLKKCQNSESYVPVKEKLMLFESLCKLGRKVRSSEDVSCKSPVECTKRARSMHDLSSVVTAQKAVREICKYFEVKSEAAGNFSKYGTVVRNNRGFNRSDSRLDNR